MNVLVTGAAGFIGSHVSEQLLDKGHRVVGLDNLNDYYDPARKLLNIQEITQKALSADTFLFVKGDIRDEGLLQALFSKHGFDAVVHLAAMAGVRASIEDPGLYFDVNLNGTLRLLEACRGHGLPHFVFASTSSVYGRTERIPFVEDDHADRPLAPYPASKRAAELLGHAYHHIHGQTFTALRFFTVYGPRGRPDMMAYKVLDNIFHDVEVPLYNGGQMHRDWTYVEDIARGIVAAAETPLGFEQINLGRGEPTLLADFVRMIESLAAKRASLTDEPMPAADITYTFADISKASRLLGYDPQVGVEDGVHRFWQWYKEAVLHR